MSILEVQNLTYTYGVGTPYEHTALENISLSFKRGESVAIIGHTGSGKSTLVQHFNGLLKPTSGTVYFRGKDIFAGKKFDRTVRFGVGLCFQYPEYQLFEETVYKDIAFGPKNMGLSKSEIDTRVKRAAKYMGLGERFLDLSPFDLSGGEKRRVAIAGILAMEPEVLVLDEPTAGLDPRGRDQIFSIIEDFRQKTGTTVIIVSHSMEDVARFADRVIALQDSKVILDGSVSEVFSHTDQLLDMGLDVPQVTQVFLELKSRGYDVNTGVFTLPQAVQEINRLRGEVAL